MYVCRWTGPCQSLRAQLLTSYGGKAKHIHIIWNMKTLSDTPQTVNDAHLYTLRHARIHTRTHTHIPHTVDVRNVLAHTHTHTLAQTDRHNHCCVVCRRHSPVSTSIYVHLLKHNRKHKYHIYTDMHHKTYIKIIPPPPHVAASDNQHMCQVKYFRRQTPYAHQTKCVYSTWHTQWLSMAAT